MPGPRFVVGDVHGHRDVLVRLLRDAGLLGAAEGWSGGDARLWLVGDLVDRGPDGIATVDLVRRLERESAGRVACLLGNHEVMLVAAHRLGGRETSAPGLSFHDLWKLNGGDDRDLRALTDERLEWLCALPALAREDEWLLLHADTNGYLALGGSLDDVVRRAAAVLRGGAADELDDLLTIVSDRTRLVEPAAVDALLDAFGGTRVVHGHTPIPLVLDVPPGEVREPLVYAEGRVVNVDHCLFAGGPGFVTRLEGGQAVVA